MLKRIFTKNNIYLGLFIILYIAIASVSTIHAIAFFNLANASVLAVMLAVTFEIGQAAVLFSILTNPNDRKRIMPWCLMCLLTLVQILGNVYSSYKYLILNSPENLRFFKEPIFVWTSLPDNIANVIITYIVGAILPVVALCLTSMVSNYLSDKEKSKEIKQEEPIVQQNNKIEQERKIEQEEPPIKIEEETEEPKKESHFINL